MYCTSNVFIETVYIGLNLRNTASPVTTVRQDDVFFI